MILFWGNGGLTRTSRIDIIIPSQFTGVAWFGAYIGFKMQIWLCVCIPDKLLLGWQLILYRIGLAELLSGDSFPSFMKSVIACPLDMY